MKLLLAHSNPIDRKRMSGVLLAEGHDVIEAGTVPAAAALLETHNFDAALLDGAVSVPVMQMLQSTGRRIYVVVAQAQWAPADIATAYGAGAHDLMKLPACKEELIGRLGGFGRMQRWAQESAAQSVDVLQLQAWRDLEAIVTSELGELVSAPLRAASAMPASLITCASEIPLVLPAESIEVRLAIGVDAAGGRALVHSLLGTEPQGDALPDALREAANIAAGAVKRAALAEGVSFTMGLPSNENLFARGTDRTRIWAACGEAGLAVACAARVLSVAPKRIPATWLREGMVIARDIKNAGGLLVASAGTYLTRSCAERLATLCGDRTLVDVTDAGLLEDPPVRRYESR